jgi:hypothetical protein
VSCRVTKLLNRQTTPKPVFDHCPDDWKRLQVKQEPSALSEEFRVRVGKLIERRLATRTEEQRIARPALPQTKGPTL